jgi:hypothetical protein
MKTFKVTVSDYNKMVEMFNELEMMEFVTLNKDGFEVSHDDIEMILDIAGTIVEEDSDYDSEFKAFIDAELSARGIDYKSNY